MLRKTIPKILAVLFLCIVALNAQAQRESLTDEFEYLSAKDRARIAKQERHDAIADTAFQTLMNNGETLFRARDYATALEEFQKARTRRPYNVHPKVKIEDLKAILAQTSLRDSLSEAAEENSARAESQETNSGATTVLTATASSENHAHKAPIEMPAGITAVRVNEELEPVNPRSPNVQIKQSIFQEGAARVLQRIIHKSGDKDEIYRKVSHSWGAIYYFKGSKTISKREWDSVFN